MYVINASGGTVSEYDTAAGGALIGQIAVPVGGGNALTGIAITPDGKSVYVTNYGADPSVNAVSQFDVGSGGALTPKSPATVPAGTLADAIAVGPATIRYRCAAVINACAISIAPVNSGRGTNAVVISATLVRTAPVGILVQRLVGKRQVRIGRFPFGLKRTGRLKIRWNLRVGGHRLPAGRYRITLRMFDRHQHLIALAHPITIAIR